MIQAEKACLNYALKNCMLTETCEKLRSINDYKKRVATCNRCHDILKYDIVTVLHSVRQSQQDALRRVKILEQELDELKLKGIEKPQVKDWRWTEGKTLALEPQQIQSIEKLHSTGSSIHAISVELGIDRRTVDRVLKNDFKNERSRAKIIEALKDKATE